MREGEGTDGGILHTGREVAKGIGTALRGVPVTIVSIWWWGNCSSRRENAKQTNADSANAG